MAAEQFLCASSTGIHWRGKRTASTLKYTTASISLYYSQQIDFSLSREPEDDQINASQAANHESTCSTESYNIDGHHQETTATSLEPTSDPQTSTDVTSNVTEDEYLHSIEPPHNIDGVLGQQSLSQHEEELAFGDNIAVQMGPTCVSEDSDVQIVGEWFPTKDEKKLDVVPTPIQPSEPAPSLHASLKNEISFKEDDLVSSTRLNLSAAVSQHDSFKVEELFESLVGDSVSSRPKAVPEHDAKSEEET